LPSILVYYENRAVRTKQLSGQLRAFSWDPTGLQLTVVGNRGTVLRLTGNDLVKLNSPTHENLRAVDCNPLNGTSLIVGNAGTVIQLDETDHFKSLTAPTSENLRAVAWNPKGNAALIAGNNGTCLEFSERGFKLVEGARANLRRIAWKPKSEEALVASNCFAEEFIPSPNLFRFRSRELELQPVNEGRADFIGVDWGPTGKSALVVGYDVVWHNGFVGGFDGSSISPIQFESKKVYPVAVAWHPTEKFAVIGTATTQPSISNGALLVWDGNSVKSIYSSPTFFFGVLAWHPNGQRLAALASSSTRTFNC
jgi:WD40 repeat protein